MDNKNHPKLLYEMKAIFIYFQTNRVKEKNKMATIFKVAEESMRLKCFEPNLLYNLLNNEYQA